MGLEDMTQWMQEVKELIHRLEQLPRTSKGPGKPATCVLAWDLSVSLYPPLRKMVAGEDYYAKPPRPIPSILSYIDKVVGWFTDADIQLIAVTDGCDHPRKLVSVERKRAADEADHKLHMYWRNNNIAEYNEVQELKKKTHQGSA